jgi:hypothetical protein
MDDDDGSGTTGSTGGGPTTVSGDGESGTSGSITDTSYTIEELKNSTNYVITVTVANIAGSTVSHPIRITTAPVSTETDCMYPQKNKANIEPVIGGAAVAIVLIISVTVMVIAILRKCPTAGRKKKADIIQIPRNEAHMVVRNETEFEESDTEKTDPTDSNIVTTTQDADDASHDSYVSVNPTQMCTSTPEGDTSNVYIDSGKEATNPTYANINVTTTQGAATTTHASYVNVDIAQIRKMKKK